MPIKHTKKSTKLDSLTYIKIAQKYYTKSEIQIGWVPSQTQENCGVNKQIWLKNVFGASQG